MPRRPVIAILVLSLSIAAGAAAELKAIAPPGTDLGLMVSSDPATGQLVPGDVATQARQTTKSVGRVFEAANAGSP